MKWIKSALFLLPVILAFILCFVRIDDYDVWWHLKCGELFLTTGWIPRTEIFSFTAEGAPWVDGYLMMQAILYACWAIGGPAGVIVLGSLMTAGIYALALFMSHRGGKGHGVALALAPFAVVFGRDQMTTRPALVFPLLSLVTLLILEKYSREKNRILYLLIPIMIFWTNSHPAFFLGPALTFIYAAAYVYRGWRGKDAGETSAGKRLLGVFAGQIASTLINPYGFKIYYTIALFAEKSFLKNFIVEWLRITDDPPGPPEMFPLFVGLCAVFAAVAVIFRRTIKIEHLLTFLFIAIATYYGRRNVMLMGAISLPLIAWTASDEDVWEKIAGLAKRLTIPLGAALIGAEIFFIWFAATNLFYIYTPNYGYRATGVGVHKPSLPVNAVELIRREKISGNVFNNLDAGGYILFNLYPQNRVLIDGRCYPYPNSAFSDMDDSFYDRKRFNEVVAKYNIMVAFLAVARPDNHALILSLLQDPGWAMILADEITALFVRVTPETEAVITKYGRGAMPAPGLFPPRHPDGRYGLFERRDYPDGSWRWANFYSFAGRPDMAVQMMQPIMGSYPHMQIFQGWLDKETMRASRMR